MILQIILLIIGLALLIKGADWMVDGASALARRYHVSDLVIGLTIVAFGTSAPEMVVNSIASFKAHSDIVFGNVIGSNIFNTFAILGLVGLITPLIVQSATVWRQIPISFAALLLAYFLCNDHLFSGDPALSRIDGLLLLGIFGMFVFYIYKNYVAEVRAPEMKQLTLSTTKTWVFIIAGLAGLVAGGQLVVTNAVDIATALGISQKVIGLTIIAAGTSLPELATSVVAAIKKNSDIAVGNIIGSNIFNILLILGVSSLVRPLPFDKLFNTDLYFLALGTLLLFAAMFTGQKKKLDRWEAAVLLVAWVAYMVYLVY